MKIGIIGAGNVGQTLARLIIKAGHEVVICNSKEPETLSEVIKTLGKGASAGTLKEVSKQAMVILAVWWDTVPRVMEQIEDWNDIILIDATNQLTFPSGAVRPTPFKLDNMTGSEYVTSLAKNARVVKAFNSLFGQYMDGETDGGNRVLFYSGDDEEAKEKLKPLFEAMGFYPVNLGNLADGGRLMQVGGALNGKHFIKRTEDMCL